MAKILLRIPLKGHIDSIFIYDVLPNVPGLEIVALEEGGGNRIFLYNHEQLFWENALPPSRNPRMQRSASSTWSDRA